jgi:hypothetical protein
LKFSFEHFLRQAQPGNPSHSIRGKLAKVRHIR